VNARVQERARYCDRAMGAARAWPGSPRSRIGHTNKRLFDRLEPIAMEIRSAPPLSTCWQIGSRLLVSWGDDRGGSECGNTRLIAGTVPEGLPLSQAHGSLHQGLRGKSGKPFRTGQR
jgi:hypothetical protein